MQKLTQTISAKRVVSGAYLTENALKIQDDRGRLQALDFLEMALPSLSIYQKYAVLNGEARLIGNSTIGIEFRYR